MCHTESICVLQNYVYLWKGFFFFGIGRVGTAKAFGKNDSWIHRKKWALWIWQFDMASCCSLELGWKKLLRWLSELADALVSAARKIWGWNGKIAFWRRKWRILQFPLVKSLIFVFLVFISKWNSWLLSSSAQRRVQEDCTGWGFNCLFCQSRVSSVPCLCLTERLLSAVLLVQGGEQMDPNGVEYVTNPAMLSELIPSAYKSTILMK